MIRKKAYENNVFRWKRKTLIEVIWWINNCINSNCGVYFYIAKEIGEYFQLRHKCRGANQLISIGTDVDLKHYILILTLSGQFVLTLLLGKIKLGF